MINSIIIYLFCPIVQIFIRSFFVTVHAAGCRLFSQQADKQIDCRRNPLIFMIGAYRGDPVILYGNGKLPNQPAPELRRIPEKYMDGGGNFWVAKDNGKTAGSIGLMKFGDGTAVLKKFFVYEPYRGAPCHLGRQLYGTLLDYARTHGVKQLILDTPKNTDRAHKFYERAGFTKIERADVPVVYDFPYEDSDFFRLEI